MENKSRKIPENCRCGFCNSEINPLSENQKYCDKICKQLAYHERRSNHLIAEKELTDFEKALNASHLRVIKGGKHRSEQIERRSSQFLAFCHSLLWPGRSFTEDEKELYTTLIKEYFTLCPDIDVKFTELIERAMLAKAYVKKAQGRFIAEPEFWFNIQYAHGLAGTFSWYEDLYIKRKIQTHYKLGEKILADAILNFCDAEDLDNFISFKNYMIEEDRFDLLGIYLNALSHITLEA